MFNIRRHLLQNPDHAAWLVVFFVSFTWCRGLVRLWSVIVSLPGHAQLFLFLFACLALKLIVKLTQYDPLKAVVLKNYNEENRLA